MGFIEPGAIMTWPRFICSRLTPRRRAPILSPASPWDALGHSWRETLQTLTRSNSLWNISDHRQLMTRGMTCPSSPMPVSIDLKCAPSPTISTSAPFVAMPRSTRPVATVPRPEIEKTSGKFYHKGREDHWKLPTFNLHEEWFLQVTYALMKSP